MPWCLPRLLRARANALQSLIRRRGEAHTRTHWRARTLTGRLYEMGGKPHNLTENLHGEDGWRFFVGGDKARPDARAIPIGKIDWARGE